MRINLILFNCLWRKVEKTRQSFHCFFLLLFTLLLSSSLFTLRFNSLIIILKELPRTFLNPETQSLEYLSLDYFLFPHKIFIIKFNFYRNLCWICILTSDIKKMSAIDMGIKDTPLAGRAGAKVSKRGNRIPQRKGWCCHVGSLKPSRWKIRRPRSKFWKNQHTSCQEGWNFGITPIIKEESHKHCKSG